jgi:hypothetical protein
MSGISLGIHHNQPESLKNMVSFGLAWLPMAERITQQITQHGWASVGIRRLPPSTTLTHILVVRRASGLHSLDGLPAGE